ncbi:HisA/HisF-related TIM barrel protein [Candidatus Vidania fulgoroideorum]
MVKKVLFIPAIDIYKLRFVRLTKGIFTSVKVIKKEELIKKILLIKPKRVHLVDLERAKNKKTKNTKLILNLIKKFNSIGIKIQVGGGLRRTKEIIKLVKMSCLVILSTKILKDKMRLNSKLNYFIKKIILSIDFKDEYVFYKGWLNKGINLLTCINLLNKSNIQNAIFTDIKKDGMMRGLDFDSLKLISKVLCKKKKFLYGGGLNKSLQLKFISVKKIPNLEGIVGGKYIYYGCE